MSVTADDGRNGVAAIDVTVHLTNVDGDVAPNTPATGAPVITGTVRAGRTLIADTSAIADDNGLTMASYRYQWLHGDDAKIPGATNGAYRLQSGDVGRTIKVRVVFIDDADYRETLTSAAAGPVEPAPAQNTPATGAPTITGTAQVGETLTADTSAIADADGLDSADYAYQWLAGDAAITGATDATYQLQPADADAAISVRVSFTDDAGFAETLTSAATAPVAIRTEQVSACHTAVGTQPLAVQYVGVWSDGRCRAHHNEHRGRYFHFTLLEDGAVSLNLVGRGQAKLFVSRATPENGWGSAPEGNNYDHRITVRLENGKLAYAGASNEVTLNLKAGNYTVEAAGDGNAAAPFTLTVVLATGVPAAGGDGGAGSQQTKPGPPLNRAPAFAANLETTLEVAENSGGGVNVGSAITATDPDEGDTVSYSLSGTDASSFAIGSGTGQIATIDGETYDYEAKSSYSVTVTATDAGGLSDSIAVTINLTEVEVTTNGQQGPPANQAPAFDANLDTTLEVPENSAAGTNVGSPITATDPDASDTLTYSLSGDDASSFAIGAGTGQITTVDGVTYDYESKASYSLTVEASDGKGGTASVAVTVNLTNVNEAPAFAANSATREVDENSSANVSVGAVITATDPDGDTLTYSLTGDDAASFSIGTLTGQIATRSGITYDYETKSSYSLTVQASDSSGLSDRIAVTVNLTDVGTPVTTCFTQLGTLSSTAEYAGSWDDAECKAHHEDSRGRYFRFTPAAATEVTITLSAGTLYVSTGGDPNNGWGTAPGGGYEHRKSVRKGNGKLVHSGGRTATLTLSAGEAYTMEAAGSSGDFTFTVVAK